MKKQMKTKIPPPQNNYSIYYVPDTVLPFKWSGIYHLPNNPTEQEVMLSPLTDTETEAQRG